MKFRIGLIVDGHLVSLSYAWDSFIYATAGMPDEIKPHLKIFSENV